MAKDDLPIDRYDSLRSIRTKLGLSQKEAADLIGIAQGTLRAWEKDSTNIGFRYILKIEQVYNVDRRFIFFGKESTFSELIRSRERIA